jgi:hypothetical protein
MCYFLYISRPNIFSKYLLLLDSSILFLFFKVVITFFLYNKLLYAYLLLSYYFYMHIFYWVTIFIRIFLKIFFFMVCIFFPSYFMRIFYVYFFFLFLISLSAPSIFSVGRDSEFPSWLEEGVAAQSKREISQNQN